MIQRLVHRFFRPLYRRLLSWEPDLDPWERVWYRPPASRFGSPQEFSWYLSGETSVVVRSLDDVCDWLLTCSYASDRETFGKDDHWQHPTTFERLRRGDCEDHALWAWRKLIELGIDAEFVVGRMLYDDEAVPASKGAHAWVLFRRNGAEWLFETVAKSRERMLFPLDEVKSRYRPEFGVTRDLRTFSFVGMAETQYEQEFQRRRPLGAGRQE